MDTLEPVVSERLFLPLLTAGRMERLLGGAVDAVEAELGVSGLGPVAHEEARLIEFRLRQVRERPGDEPWLLRPIALRAGSRAVIGLLNFHGSPDDRGFAEIGYGLDPARRGQGYAIEAVRAMFDWAAERFAVTSFRASISPDNERSVNLVRKLGMRRVGAQWDEVDGLELIWTVTDWGSASPDLTG